MAEHGIQLSRRGALATLAVAAVSGWAGTRANAASYPTKNITFVVGYAPGGTSDAIARSVGDELGKRTGRTVVVDFRPGGGGGIAGDLVARSKPDGHMLLAVSNTFYAVTPFLGNVQYDPLTDLTPVGFAGDGYLIAAVHPSIPVKNITELVAYAKANPGKLNYASNGIGSLTHLCGEYFKRRTGTDLVHVPYRGAGDAIQSTLKNETQVNFSIGDAVYHQRGELRAIANLGTARWSQLPDVMSTEESGMPGWAIRSWHGVAVPKGTPQDICEFLNKSVNEIAAMPAISKRLGMLGLYFAPQTLDQLDQRRKDDHAAFKALIRDTGIKAL
jgi:tripartite-type tricarboxylate transporter receptor subunit TctC